MRYPWLSWLGRLIFAAHQALVNKRFLFSATTISLLGSKATHIYAYRSAIPSQKLFLWGPSLFLQDATLLLILHASFHNQWSPPWCRQILLTFSIISSSFVLWLGIIVNAFFQTVGSELHWRNVALAADSNSWSMLSAGFASLSLVVGSTFVCGWLFQDWLYHIANIALLVVSWPVLFVCAKYRSKTNGVTDYQLIPYSLDDSLLAENVEIAVERQSDTYPSKTTETDRTTSRMHMLGIICISTLIVLGIARPEDKTLGFMAWTLPLLPFVDLMSSGSGMRHLTPAYNSSIVGNWDNFTALTDPAPFPWLPKNGKLAGFEDWYEENQQHYNTSKDPLKITNLEEQLLPGLREQIAGLDIRHVMLIVLESTRKDAFPITKKSKLWETLLKSYDTQEPPLAIQEKISSFSSNARLLTGDYTEQIHSVEAVRRGGINANNVYTASTYTLKSLTGILCGLSPAVADFNVEYTHHCYQPCLPHLFEAMNNMASDEPVVSDDFTSFPWKSTFMQSVTEGFDHQNKLFPQWGFNADNVVTKEYLRSNATKFGTENTTDINYFGMQEEVLEAYISDAFSSARDNNERVFLTHLTSTSHHPFSMPANEDYIPLSKDKHWDDLSHYMNAIGYVDRWLGKILNILDKQGVSNETLLVLVGDHGLSIPEENQVTPYYVPNAGSFHVPLIFSHPQLPQVDVDQAAISLQILPTILDLLLESGSVAKSRRSIVRDILGIYEGQSILRPLKTFSALTGQVNWQHTVMNPGGAAVAVRDARQPHWRLITPVMDDTQWRFTDLETDQYERDALESLDFVQFQQSVEQKHGIEARKWVQEAAFITQWWVQENRKRWHLQV